LKPINEKGQLTLDQTLENTKPQRVRVIVLMSEEEENDPDETPTSIVIEGIRQGLQEALSGPNYSPFRNVGGNRCRITYPFGLP
jgi:hypothetical protein